MPLGQPNVDFTLHTERTGNMALSTPTEHVLGVLRRILYTVPGRDDYNTDYGLNLRAKVRPAGAVGNRDTEYEQEIREQLLAYTDLRPT